MVPKSTPPWRRALTLSLCTRTWLSTSSTCSATTHCSSAVSSARMPSSGRDLTIYSTTSASPDQQHLRERYNDAKLYLLVLEALEEMSKPRKFKGVANTFKTKVRLGDELSAEFLKSYAAWAHEERFPPRDRSIVKELVADGRQKVLMKLCEHEPTPKRSGKPRSRSTGKRLNNGWFMVMDPHTSRILVVTTMLRPENNKIATSYFAQAAQTIWQCQLPHIRPDVHAEGVSSEGSSHV